MLTSASERLRELISGLGETQSSFARKLDIPQSTIATAIMRGSDLSSLLTGRVLMTYPHVNLDWLLTGEGDMFKNESERIPPGDLLQLYLKEKGITKEEFADKMGISIEEADKHFNLKDGNMDYMHEWAKALGTKTTELFMSADTYLMYMEREENTVEDGLMKNKHNDYYKPFIDRVNKLAETLRETQYSFLKKIKYPLSSIDSIKGGDDINELIRCIFKTYPNVNIGWLITGEDEGMFKRDGVVVKFLREKHGYSISEISDYLGVKEHYYKSLEDGKIPLEDDYRKLLAEKYQVEELGLISEDDYIPPKSKRLTKDNLEEECSIPVIDNTQETRPRIPLNAAAGSVSVALSGVSDGDCEQLPFVSAFSNYNYTILVKGDSMEPEFHSGDELACLQLNNGKANFIQWGRYHVLDTAQGVVVKRIYDDGDTILCKSENELYSDFRIHKEDVYNIGLVIGMLRRF